MQKQRRVSSTVRRISARRVDGAYSHERRERETEKRTGEPGDRLCRSSTTVTGSRGESCATGGTTRLPRQGATGTLPPPMPHWRSADPADVNKTCPSAGRHSRPACRQSVPVGHAGARSRRKAPIFRGQRASLYGGAGDPPLHGLASKFMHVRQRFVQEARPAGAAASGKSNKSALMRRPFPLLTKPASAAGTQNRSPSCLYRMIL